MVHLTKWHEVCRSKRALVSARKHTHTHTDINAYMCTHTHKKNKHAYLATADLISPIFSRAQKSPVVCSKRVSILQMLPLTTTYHVTSLLTDMWHRPHANPSEGLASHDHTHRCCLRPDSGEKDQLHRSLFSPQHPNECIKNAWVTINQKITSVFRDVESIVKYI